MKPRSQAPVADEAVVLVVDDDPSMRQALSDLIESVGLRVQLYASVPELLGRPFPDVAGCLVLDVRLPGPRGLDFQERLAKANVGLLGRGLESTHQRTDFPGISDFGDAHAPAHDLVTHCHDLGPHGFWNVARLQ